MYKFLFLFLITACDQTPNKAQVMIQAQVPEAKCWDPTDKGVEVVYCQLPAQGSGSDKLVPEILGFSSGKHPFQYYQLKTATMQQKESETTKPDATKPGTGVGSGSAPKK